VTAGRAPWAVLVALLLLVAAFGLRARAAAPPGLWADEIFSLAVATGHSLEHPAAAADPSAGDFVQATDAVPPPAYRRYAEFGDPPAGPGRVIRAVLLSDTSPPVYYLLLNVWCRVLGPSDAALRAFSICWALASLPLAWLIGRRLDGSFAGWSACLLLAFAPVAFFYSLEGRMYAMVGCLVLALIWLTLRLTDAERPRSVQALWILVGAAGLLTHYFFVFPWAACVGWLLWIGAGRRLVALLTGATAVLVAPWFAQVPATLARWRLTADWLDGVLIWPTAVLEPIRLSASLLGARSDLGGWQQGNLALLVILAAMVVLLARAGAARAMLARPLVLLWGCWIAATAGPLVFDLARHTTTSAVARYFLPGLPAAVLLAAVAISRLPRPASVAVLGAVLLCWLPGTWKASRAPVPRPNEPYTVLDRRIESWAQPGDVVLVRSLPSGVIGVARYLERDIPLVAWVTQLGTRRTPADLERVLRGRRRVALAMIHTGGAVDPVQPWLEANARLLGRETFRRSSAEVLYFAPLHGETFFAPTDVAARWE
jgi:Dolichyl-phosphate-mannose-protein mannosyltransferase